MKKIINLNLEEKHQVILLKTTKNMSVQELAKRYACGTTQIYQILRNKDAIEQLYLSSNANEKSGKKKRNCCYEQLNEILFEWFGIARSKSFPISGTILKAKALEIAKRLDLISFKASNGWLNSFRNRYQISFKVACGDSKKMDEDVVQSWIQKLPAICQGYSIENIANCDETALFFKALPNKTLHLKNDKCFGGKYSKERITVLLTAFADGKKYKTVIIGKSENPRCFNKLEKSKLKCLYFWNKKAWMTAKIFEQYLNDLNETMIKQNRKILLFLDNVSSHFTRTFSNVQLQFLPANTTSRLQPLDGGIIQNFKCHYKKILLQNFLLSIDDCKNTSELTSNITILHAINFAHEALEKVTSTCIRKCFQNCGFQIPEILSNEALHVVQLQNIIRTLYGDDIYSANDYIEIDANAITEIEVNDPESVLETIISNNYSKHMETPLNLNSETHSIDDILINKSDMYKSFRTIEIFSAQIGDNDLYELITSTRNEFQKKLSLPEKKKQTTMDCFLINKYLSS